MEYKKKGESEIKFIQEGEIWVAISFRPGLNGTALGDLAIPKVSILCMRIPLCIPLLGDYTGAMGDLYSTYIDQ